MNVKILMDEIEQLGIKFFTGVPDSQLKALCDEIYDKYELGKQHIVAANEGAAVALAAGHYLASGEASLVYMQNSGIGNAINPIASLIDKNVYKIPMVFVIGWRGEPGVKDEPQHVFQGQITTDLLEIMKIPYYIINGDITKEKLKTYMIDVQRQLKGEQSVAFIVRKGALERDKKAGYTNAYTMSREEALKIIVNKVGKSDIVVSTTGKLSRELFEIRAQNGQGHEKDFLTVGSMGHASMIAMGIALEQPQRKVWCLDGDGAAIMHMGSMDIVAGTSCPNLIHIVFNNEAHETVGGMPVAYGKTDFTQIAKALKYRQIFPAVETREELEKLFIQNEELMGPVFLEIKIALGSRQDLGRPTETPTENKQKLMNFLQRTSC